MSGCWVGGVRHSTVDGEEDCRRRRRRGDLELRERFRRARVGKRRRVADAELVAEQQQLEVEGW